MRTLRGTLILTIVGTVLFVPNFLVFGQELNGLSFVQFSTPPRESLLISSNDCDRLYAVPEVVNERYKAITIRRKWSPLTAAIWSEDYVLAAFFLGKGADPNFPLEDGTTPLMLLSLKRKISNDGAELGSLIVGIGCDVNAVNIRDVEFDTGNTALHCAIKAINLPMVKILLKGNARTDIANSSGLFAADLARLTKQQPLENNGSDEAIQKKADEIFRLLTQ
jgi:hypothetical protein